MTEDDTMDERALGDSERTDISVLASAVIGVMNDKTDEVSQTIRNSVVGKLVDAILSKGSFNAETLLIEFKDSRVEPDQMVDIYIPEAARRMGEMWTDDIIGFAQVTIGTARLQGLLTLLAPPWSVKPDGRGQDRQILLILESGDTHTLGPHVATAQLRRMGAFVRILFGPDTKSLMRVLSEEPFDLVMFSIARVDALASVAKIVKRIRTRSEVTPPIVLGGLVLNLTDHIKDRTGVDLVTGDVKVAYKLSERKRHKTRSVAQ